MTCFYIVFRCRLSIYKKICQIQTGTYSNALSKSIGHYNYKIVGMKNIIVCMSVLICSCQLFSGKQNRSKLQIEWNNIPIQELPFSMSGKDIELCKDKCTESWIKNLENFYLHYGKQFGIHQELDSIFNRETSFNNEEWEELIKPSNEPGYYFCRLPDFDTFKLVLFASSDENIVLNYNARNIWLELQIIDQNNIVTDKMIVYFFLGGECSIRRSFTIVENGRLNIEDREVCVDLFGEPGDIATNKTTNLIYKISDLGKLIKVEK